MFGACWRVSCSILMCTLLWLKVFWCSLMNYWCVWTVNCYLEVLYHNVYSNRIYTSWTWWRPITVLLCEPPPLQSVTSVFYKRLLSSVFRGFNKGCAKISCLYSSTRVSISPEMLICCSWKDTGVHHEHPPLEHHSPYAESPQPPPHGPSAQMNTHEHLLSPPEIRVWMLQLLTGRHTTFRFPS